MCSQCPQRMLSRKRFELRGRHVPAACGAELGPLSPAASSAAAGGDAAAAVGVADEQQPACTLWAPRGGGRCRDQRCCAGWDCGLRPLGCP